MPLETCLDVEYHSFLMDLTSLSPEVLRELAKLADQKVALLKQISDIDGKFTAVAHGNSPKPSSLSAANKKAAPKAKTGRRGHLKGQIVGLLEKAGYAGLAVKEISKTLGVKNQNVHVWFSTTGKKVEGITKLDGAKYALRAVTAVQEASPAPSTPIEPSSPAPAAQPSI